MAPLLDAIQAGAYKDMVVAVKKKEEWFLNKIKDKKKKEQALQKKLASYEKPK